MSHTIYLYQPVVLSPSSQSLPSSNTHSHLRFTSSSLPFHNILSPVSPITLDIQHFLKPFTVTTGEMYCYAAMIHIDYIIHSYFLVYKLTWIHEEDLQFSPQMVVVVSLSIYVLDFCLWPDKSEFMALIYMGWSKIFRTDTVKIVKLTIRPIARHHPHSSSLPHVDTCPTISIIGMLPGSPFLSECQAFSAIWPGSPQWYQTGVLSASISVLEIGRSHRVPNQGSTVGGG